MEEIKTFINEFLKAEATASDAFVKPDLADYNNKLAHMNSFCVKELQNKFGMMPLLQLRSDDFYKEWKDYGSRNPRHIYKISHYKNETYGDVYVVYISQKNPDNVIFVYETCLFVTMINNELKIVKYYTFGDGMRIKDKFETAQGIEDISFKILKKPIEIERYREPEDDDDAMEHYLMDL